MSERDTSWLDRLRSSWWIPAGALIVGAAGSGIAVITSSFAGESWLDAVIAIVLVWSVAASVAIAVDQATAKELPFRAVGSIYASLVGAAYLGIRIGAETHVSLKLEGDFHWFAILFIVALAIERLLEPLMQTAATAEDKKANNASATDAIRTNRAMIAFLLGSSVGLLICGLLDLGLIGAVAEVEIAEPNPESWQSAFRSADIVITGLAIGAGTKPLHDLITAIQKKAS